MNSPLRLGTRGSPLALWQANFVADKLRPVAAPRAVELVLIETHGDRDQATALAAMGGFGVFTKAIQSALLDGRGSSLANVRRRVEVRLADDQVDDGLALPAQFVGSVCSRGAGRWLDTPDAFGDAGGAHGLP